MPYTVRSHPRDFAVFPKVAHRARINVAAGAGTHLQQHEVGFLRDLAGIVLAAPLGYDDVGFRWPDEWPPAHTSCHLLHACKAGA